MSGIKVHEGTGMKTRSFAMVLLLALEALGDPQICCFAQEKREPFSLTVKAPETVTTNAKLVVKVLLTNTSDKDLVVLQCGYTDYVVDLEGIGTTKASETDLGTQLNHKLLGRVCMTTRRVLKPNEAFSDEIPIDELYRMDSPGQYVIRVQRDLSSWMGSKGTIKSNSVKFTVTPHNAQP
jgi:hypothetical protein